VLLPEKIGRRPPPPRARIAECGSAGFLTCKVSWQARQPVCELACHTGSGLV